MSRIKAFGMGTCFDGDVEVTCMCNVMISSLASPVVALCGTSMLNQIRCKLYSTQGFLTT